MEILTAIVPCFNEEAVIPMFYDEIMRVAELMKNEVEFEETCLRLGTYLCR